MPTFTALTTLEGRKPAYALGEAMERLVPEPTGVGVFDTATDTFSTVPTGLAYGGYKYNGATTIGTTVYFTPQDADTIGIFDLSLIHI